MTTLALRAKNPAPARALGRRGLARFLAAVTAAFGTVFEVIDEATDQSAAARRRFPTSD
ncbi:MAG: hypothetical protein WCA56_18250 [Xanthobacteraceae bacterium]|jgi:hypothetical protein